LSEGVLDIIISAPARIAIDGTEAAAASHCQPKGRAVYTFTAHNPQPGALQWKAHQTFADGSMRHWVGERGSKDPAAVTTVVTKGDATKPAPEPEHKH
jgi:hypothetical protein